MAENTAIEWADHTFNPWTGCTKVSPGCDHCYAEAEYAYLRAERCACLCHQWDDDDDDLG